MALRLRNGVTINRTNAVSQENLDVNRAKPITSNVNKQGLVDVTKKLNGGLQARNEKRPALGEISRNVGIPISSNSTLKKEAFAKPTIPVQTKPSANPVVRTTKTVLARQSLITKTSTLPKVSTSTISKTAINSSNISSSSTITSRLVNTTQKLQRPTVPKPAKSTFSITHAIRGPRVPEDADFKDFDEAVYTNPLFLGVYCSDMYAYMRELEKKFLVKEDFMCGQIVSTKMRAMVVDWLVDVQQQYNLLMETFHLAVGIFDRFLEKCRTITKNKLQLVGVTAMWIAAKYEEMFSPELINFVFITDNAFTKKEILKMEYLIHDALDFCYGQPLAIHFLRRYSHVCEAEPRHHVIAKYLLELSRVDFKFSYRRPSLLAAAALCTSFCIVDENYSPDSSVWTEALDFYSTYKLEEVKPLVAELADLVLKSENSKLQGVRTKYASTKQMKISTYLTGKGDLLKKLAEMDTTCSD